MTMEQTLYELWLENVRDNPLFFEELGSIQGNAKEIEDRFYTDLEFGTAGLRGVLGVGTNRMNTLTVGRATQGFANYILQQCETPSVAIAYDSRINSDVFAKETASIFAANGIKVHLFAELMPTPTLSYAVRELHCDAGVVITASHNPAKYNGYKAYGNDGCQIGQVEADSILAESDKVNIFTDIKKIPFDQGVKDGSICMIPESFVQQYLARVFEESINPEVCAKAGLKLVYTPLNGAGNRCVQTILKMAGVTDINVVPEQEQPDGNFPTCAYPNPETKEALSYGLALCKKLKADLLLATDPDADRVAVACKTGDDYRIITGNELGVLLLDYIASAKTANGSMPKNPVAVKSIVSTKLADAVCKQYGVEMVDVLTGFKYIGEVILGLEKKGETGRYIFGFEESCGYLSGGFVRDKDAVNASLLVVEMASAYKLLGKTLTQRLGEIYALHGIYLNKVESFAFEGADGMKLMADIMQNLRQNPLNQLGENAVVTSTDYQTRVKITSGVTSAISLPKANVLEYTLDNNCTVIVRPSGTEPKIKLYYSIVGSTQEQVEKLAEYYSEICSKLVIGK